MKHKELSFVAFILTVCMLVSTFAVFAFAEKDTQTVNTDFAKAANEVIPESNEITVSSEMSEEDTDTEIGVKPVTGSDYQLIPIIDEFVTENSDAAQITIDNQDVVEYNIVADGVEVVSSSTETGKIQFSAIDEFGAITIEAVSKNGSKSQCKLYTYKTETETYVSDVSRDAAWHLAMMDQLNKGEISKSEYDMMYGELTREHLLMEATRERLVTQRSLNQYSFGGHISFGDSTGKYEYPVKRAKLVLYAGELMADEYVPIAETYTDDNGDYYFDIDPAHFIDGSWFYIRLFPCSEVTSVYSLKYSKALRDILPLDYFSAFIQSVKFQYSETLYRDLFIAYSEDWSFVTNLHIHQGMVMGEIFSENMGVSWEDNHLTVFYPLPALEKLTSFSWQGICGITLDNFAEYDTILHEYGHFVQQTSGIFGPTIKDYITSGGPQHNSHDDHFFDKTNLIGQTNVEYAMELTWSEAWATIFSVIVQQYFGDEYVFEDENGNYFANEYYCGKHMNIYAPDNNACEAQERAVEAALYDFYDKDTGESFDTLKLGARNWFNWTTKPGMYTLADFMDYIFAKRTSSLPKIANIMQAYRISPTITETMPSTLTTTLAPTVCWTPNGSVSNPNAAYVAVYDQDWTCIYSQEIATAYYDEEKYFNFSQDTWEDIFRQYTGVQKFYLAMVGYKNGDADQSGPYLSNVVEIQMNRDISMTFTPDDNYAEVKVGIPAGGTEEVRVVFSESGYVVLQTFGELDTTMEIVNTNTQNIVKSFNDTNDKGYGVNAYARVYVTSGVEYLVKIKCTYPIASGRIKLSMLYGGNYSGVEGGTISEYDNIYLYLHSFDTSEISFSTFNKYMHATRLTTSYSKEYTITVNCGNWTVLGVVDPLSNKLLVLFEDVTVGMPAIVTAQLEANKEYLLLFGIDDPDDFNSSNTLVLNIQ